MTKKTLSEMTPGELAQVRIELDQQYQDIKAQKLAIQRKLDAIPEKNKKKPVVIANMEKLAQERILLDEQMQEIRQAKLAIQRELDKRPPKPLGENVLVVQVGEYKKDGE